MPDDKSSETVTVKTMSGDYVDFIIPGGLSDAEAKTFILSKRPDLFSTTATPDTQTFNGSLHSYLQGATQGQTPGANQITGISAQPKPTGMMDSLARWTDNVATDLKYGTDLTGVGTVLKKLGAHGVYNGNPQAVGDFMASLPLGLAQATKGVAETAQPGKRYQGAKDIVSGAAQAVQIPAAFMGGPGVEAGAGATAAAGGKLFGNVQKAGQLFNEVATAAKGSEIPVTDEMYQAASRAMELSDAGAKGLPRVISKFMNRVTDPEKAPIDWNTARDFFSNVSRLSANEYQSLNPQMAGAVAKFAGAFDDALRATAAAAGKGDEYSQAMQLYSTAKSWQKFGANVWGGFKQSLPFIGGGATGGALGAYAYNKLRELANTK